MKKSSKNIFFRVGCLMLSILLLASMFACAKPPVEEPVDEDVFVITDPTKDTYVVKNGISFYKILVPKRATEKIQFAASELQYFFELITGVKLEIVDHADNLQGKYFSLGNTEIMQASGITTTFDELGMSGYRVKTYGDAIVMAGENDYSTNYAVYGYLARQFGLEIYAEDIYRIHDTKDAKLLDIDWTDIPDIQFRNGGVTILSWYTGEAYMSRMRYRNMEEFWGLVSHSYFTVLPPSQYLSAHPDWYNNPQNPRQPCLTNQGMIDQFVENLKKIILDKPNHHYFMLGIEDNTVHCECSGCRAVCNEYGGLHSAVAILFTNEVVSRINEWAAQAIPDRELYFGMFGYFYDEEPPVEYDASTDTYYPMNHDEKLMLEPNLGVMIAPLTSHSSAPYMDQEKLNRVFRGWDALSDIMYVWSYCCNFSNYIAPYDGFDVYAENYRAFKEMGVRYLFDQGSGTGGGGRSPNFEQLRDWLSSKLMWDSSLDTETLVRDFMKHYYGPGWESVYEFYTLWRLRMVELREQIVCDYYGEDDWLNREFYPKALLDQYEKLLADALLTNEALKETDPAMYARYRDNIRAVRCMVRYLSLSLYEECYDYDTYKAMIDEFEDIVSIKGLYKMSEGGATTSDELLTRWNKILSYKQAG